MFFPKRKVILIEYNFIILLVIWHTLYLYHLYAILLFPKIVFNLIHFIIAFLAKIIFFAKNVYLVFSVAFLCAYYAISLLARA